MCVCVREYLCECVCGAGGGVGGYQLRQTTGVVTTHVTEEESRAQRLFNYLVLGF